MTWTDSLIAATCTLINCAALIYGGIVDANRREIPNAVPLIIIATGLLCGGHLLARLILALLTAGAILLAAKLTKVEMPGGDFKLICALAFSDGTIAVGCTLVVAALGMAIVSAVRHKPLKRKVPLCSYVAAGYVLLSATMFI